MYDFTKMSINFILGVELLRLKAIHSFISSIH